MSRGAALVVSVCASVSVLAACPLAAAEDPAPLTLHVRLSDRPKEDVQSAVTGALRRLEDPRCAGILEELQDEDGVALSARLEATRLRPREYLASLRFLEGADEGRCHSDSVTVAFTQPGSRVVYICSQRFSAFPRNSVAADVSILHEFLHSLGLGEHPPSPGAISHMVQDHCGDRQ